MLELKFKNLDKRYADYGSFNRTMLELKSAAIRFCGREVNTFNRTMLELKWLHPRKAA